MSTPSSDDIQLENGNLGREQVTARDPSGFLSQIIGAPVTIKLNSGITYKGNLQSVDGYMNIALEGCQEVVDENVVRSWGDAFIRGNNVMYISADRGNPSSG
ncbi:LSM domain-containing protein [Lojkania enalia]|uniref:U6 snRNA-associated Sm-like protein LSm6 n=1 Tax=Lojkania enalia TaxID=147567 RepID=A0A9P4K2V1_9PLEO|nr:LSM domain-containing protein [Didymosphaeria enalia]